MLKKFPQSNDFHTVTCKDLTNINQTQFVIKDEPINTQDPNNSYPVF